VSSRRRSVLGLVLSVFSENDRSDDATVGASFHRHSAQSFKACCVERISALKRGILNRRLERIAHQGLVLAQPADAIDNVLVTPKGVAPVVNVRGGISHAVIRQRRRARGDRRKVRAPKITNPPLMI